MLVKAPSKLYLAGEFGILRDNSYAILISTDKYTYLEIDKSDVEIVDSSVSDKDKLLKYARDEAFNFAKKYESLSYRYKTQLYENGKKYGLGSSASVVVVTIKGILEYFNIAYTKKDLFTLSVNALKKAGQKGSMGDVAAISYEGLILYQNGSYIVRNIEVKNKLLVRAIWTKKEASTKKQIENIQKVYDTKEFNDFCDKSDLYTLAMVKALENGDKKLLKDSIKNLRLNLENIEKILGIKIYSKEVLNLLKDDMYKPSGAGKGDFVINLDLEEEEYEKGPAYRVCFEM